jgi:c-di-GMP-binding flagellar brake protein YcgR
MDLHPSLGPRMEQRKFQRFSDNSHVIFSSDAFNGEGRLDNLSLGGAAILSDIAIARGEYLALKIMFPTQAGAIEVELAPVRWVKEGSFGVEFIRIAPGSQQRLKQYVATLEGASSDAA